jgi:hypothetical protein
MLPSWIPYRTHCECLGRSQYGKTSWCLYCRRRHILAGNTVWSLDYKSGGYQGDVAFIARARPDFPAIFLNVSNPDVIVPYNPFSLPIGRELGTHVNHLAEVVLKVVSKQPLTELQNYIRVAEAFFAHVAISKIPIFQALHMLEYDERRLWLDGSAKMPDPQFADEMRRISLTPKNDWKFEVTSLRNRLRPFTTSPALRRIMQGAGVDLGDCFRRNISLFVNATPSRGLTGESARIFLGLILSDIMLIGLEHAEDPHTTLLYLDEAQEYSTPELGTTLDLVLASGILATIIHHYEGQMDDKTQQSLSVNAGIKAVFGGLDAEKRIKFTEDAYAGQLNERHHKQPRISFVTEYEEEVYEETSDTDGGFSNELGGGDSWGTTKRYGSRLRPSSKEVITGYDDYTREEVRSRLAANFILPKREYIAILPDHTERMTVPTIAKYLYDSPESLSFRQAIPGIPLDEADRNNPQRSPDASTKRTRKVRATLFNAE